MDYNKIFTKNKNVDSKLNNNTNLNLNFINSLSKISENINENTNHESIDLHLNVNNAYETNRHKKSKNFEKDSIRFCTKSNDSNTNNMYYENKKYRNNHKIHSNKYTKFKKKRSIFLDTTKSKKLFLHNTCNIYKKVLIFSDNKFIQSSIDIEFKDFDFLLKMLKIYNNKKIENCYSKIFTFFEIEQKLVKVFKDRIFDLKLLLCLKNIDTIEKNIFDAIVSKMKQVLAFLKKEDCNKLFLKIKNEFMFFDASYIYFIKIIECYMCLNC